MSADHHVLREIEFELPSGQWDLYALHQQVWSLAEQAARPGVRPQYLYRVQEGVVRLRSRDFQHGDVSEFEPGTYDLALAAVIQKSGGGESPVNPAHIERWAADKLARAGFYARSLEVLGYQIRGGFKHDKTNERRHRIVMPVLSLRLDLEVIDPESALQSWSTGIGRGKRFGLGMLCG